MFDKNYKKFELCESEKLSKQKDITSYQIHGEPDQC